MDRRRNPARLARPLACAVAVFAIALTGCDRNTIVGRAPAATVNGTAISVADMRERAEDQLVVAKAQAKQARSQGQGQGQGQGATAVPKEIRDALEAYSEADGRLSARAMSFELNATVTSELYEQVLARHHGHVTKADRSSAKTQLLKQLKSGYGLEEKDLPERYLSDLVDLQATVDAIKRTAPASVTPPSLSDAEYEKKLRSIYDQDPGQYDQVCVSIIVTADQASATAALDRVKGGEDFAKVAAEVSLDTGSGQNGGDVGCSPMIGVRSVFPDVVGAKTGTLLGPGTSSLQDGSVAYLIGKVNGTKKSTFEDVRDGLAANNPQNDATATDQALQEYVRNEFVKEAKRAKVSVDPRFGQWDPETQQVVPPG